MILSESSRSSLQVSEAETDRHRPSAPKSLYPNDMPELSPAGRKSFDLLASRLSELHYPNDSYAKFHAIILACELRSALDETTGPQKIIGPEKRPSVKPARPPSSTSSYNSTAETLTPEHSTANTLSPLTPETPPLPPPRKRYEREGRALLALDSPQHTQRSWILEEERRSLAADLDDEWESEEDLDSIKQISGGVSASSDDIPDSDILVGEPSWSAGARKSLAPALLHEQLRPFLEAPKSPGPMSPGPESPRAKSPSPRPRAPSRWDSLDLSRRGKWLGRLRAVRMFCVRARAPFNASA